MEAASITLPQRLVVNKSCRLSRESKDNKFILDQKAVKITVENVENLIEKLRRIS